MMNRSFLDAKYREKEGMSLMDLISNSPMSDKQIKEMFERHQAIITGGHFVYAKKAERWFHGSVYVNKDAIYPHVEDLRRLCREIARRFVRNKIDIVVGPTIGGVALSQWVAYELSQLQGNKSSGKILAVFAEEEDIFEEKGMASPIKVGTRRILKRGYEKLVAGKKCLIVEDIINSGTTVMKTAEAIRANGGKIVGVGALCNRSGGRVTARTLDVPKLKSLLNLDLAMYPENECPICQESGKDTVNLKLGKGKEFLQRIGMPLPE